LVAENISFDLIPRSVLDKGKGHAENVAAMDCKTAILTSVEPIEKS